MKISRTFHNYLHIPDKTMDHTQCLRNDHPSFILGQSIQSLEDPLYLALPQQLLRKFYCGAVTLSSVKWLSR